jgi:hypothetical protein
MSKVKISEFSSTPGNNTDIDGINLAEGCAPSGINDAIRELMAQLKDFQTGAAGDSFNGPVGTSTAAAGAFTTLSATGVTTVQAGSAGAPAITTSGDTNTGIFFPAADTIAFSEGGVESMRLNASGNLGLGATPSAWPSGQGAMQFKDGGLNAWSLGIVNGYLYSNAYYDGSNNRYINNGTACSYSINNGSGIHAWFNAPSGTAGNAITFTQAMTLDSSGNLLVGTTNTSANPTGFSAVQYSGGTYTRIAHNSSAGSSDGYIQFFYDSTQIGSVAQNGTSTVQYLTSSDYRLKKDIQPITGALEKISSLNPVAYKWITDDSEGEGFIAHELAEVCPHAVNGEKDATRMEQYEISPAVPATFDEEGNELTAAVEAVMGEREVPSYQGIDTSFLVATLTAAIQELKAIVDAQGAEIAALKAK